MSSNAIIPNIYVIGPQSTGKTTLVNKLRDALRHWLAGATIEPPQIVTEVARTVLTKHKYTANDITSSTDRCLALQKLILEAQASAEKEALLRSSWFISDRSGFDPLVYAREYVSPGAVVEMQQLPAWVEVKARMEKSLIVVCEAGTPWLMDDGVRLMPDSEDAWMKLSRDFCDLLDETGFGYCVVPRTMLELLERAQFVLAKWEERRLSLNQSISV
jgi:nicotinamide riboside kinase